MCLTFALFENRVRVAERLEKRSMGRPSRGAAHSSADEPTVLQIALDWDFENECFAHLEFESSQWLVERYISDICSECEYLEKRPLDDRAKARSCLIVQSFVCRRYFCRLIFWSNFS